MNAFDQYIQNNLKKIRFTLALLLVCFALPFLSSAQSIQVTPLGKNATVSLLTASPGEEVYAQYGHTAIRVHDPEKRIDLAFNYGLFDFDSPNFLWRFVKGQTDYMVGACSYLDFLIEYQVDNRAVTEQVINLTPEEKEAVWEALILNIQPENRTYRYNFIYNNCSTKPRDILVQSISGKVNYQFKGKFKSLRDEIHFFTAGYPWTQFGIDLLLGVKADKPADLKSQQFAPDVLMESFSKAVVANDSARVRTLVLETTQPATIDPTQKDKPTWSPGPVLVMWIVFLIIALFSFFELRNGKQHHVVNALLFGIMGLLGTIITFMALFSEHPTTDVNFLLLWIHPIHLVFAIGMIFAVFRKKVANIYLSINLPFQLFALAGIWFLPQYVHPAMYPILISLMLRSGLALFSLQKKRTHA